jgi:hypothetical protein
MTRFRSSRVAAVAVIAAAAITVLPAPAHADATQTEHTPYDQQSVKAVTATCPDGEHVTGGGGGVIDGQGNVALAAVIPDASLTSVVATGIARPGYTGAWAVAVTATCSSRGGTPQRVASGPATTVDGVTVATAACPAGWNLVGTGFDLTDLAHPARLVGLAPNADLTSVSVRVATDQPVTGAPTAFGICLPQGGNGHYHPFYAGPAWSAPTAGDSTSATVTNVGQEMFGAGGVLVGNPAGVFIDYLMPGPANAVRVHASRVGTAKATGVAVPAIAPGDDWGVGAIAVGVVYY